MPDLVVFVPSLQGGGMERVAVDLANGMSRSGILVHLVAASKQGPYAGDVDTSVKLVDLKSPRVRSAVIPLARYLRRSQPEVVLSVGFHANVAAWAARRLSMRRMRLVTSEHNILGASLTELPTLGRLLMGRLVPLAYRGSDEIVAVSNGVKIHLQQLLGRGLPAVSVIYNPVALTEIRARSRAPAGHPWLDDAGLPTLLSVGRLVPQKDHATLIRAFGALRARRRVRLLLVGEGPERLAIERLVEQLGLTEDVDLPGFSPNPYAMMARASMLVLSSRREGLGVVLIEALALGTPIVSTDCPSGPAEILQDGVLGRLVPVGDPSAMASAMEDVLEGRFPMPPLNAADRYDVKTVCDTYLELLGLEGS